MTSQTTKPTQHHSRVWSALFDTLWILILAVIALFAFCVALGAFAPGDVLTVTITVGALTILWIAHALWAARGPNKSNGSQGAGEHR